MSAFQTKGEYVLDAERLEIRGDGIRLRPVVEADAADIFTYFDRDVTRYMSPAPALDIEETLAVIRRWDVGRARGDELVLAITLRETGEFLGCCGLHGRGKVRTPELGIWTKTEAHGHGYGREAIFALVDWAQEHLDIDHFTYPVDRANIPSRKIPEALGGKIFKEKLSPTPDGRVLDIVIYRIDAMNKPCCGSIS